MNIYLDIDGVFRGVESPVSDLTELMTFVLDNFPGHVFWLTTHVWRGANNAVRALVDVFDDDLLRRLDTEVQATNWGDYKTDAIDFDEDFIWLDDDLGSTERMILENHGALDGHFMMDWRDPEMAKKALAEIKSRMEVIPEVDEMTDRARGSMVGLAVGDALGVPIEFGWVSQDIEKNLEEIRTMPPYHGIFGLWSDDTSMALCMADSILEHGGYDSYDVMTKYLYWRDEGLNSMVNGGFGIGNQTNHTLSEFVHDPVVKADAEKEWAAGNGGIMRIAPAVIVRDNVAIEEAVELARISARETHNSLMVEMTAEVFGAAIHLALNGAEKDRIIEECFEYVSSDLKATYKEVSEDMHRRIGGDGSCLRDLGGYTVDALVIALWGFANADGFEDGMMKVLALGGDADTNAAIYGQLAGAYYGYNQIPERWRKTIGREKSIRERAEKLHALEECPILATRFEEDIEKGYFE